MIDLDYMIVDFSEINKCPFTSKLLLLIILLPCDALPLLLLPLLLLFPSFDNVGLILSVCCNVKRLYYESERRLFFISITTMFFTWFNNMWLLSTTLCFNISWYSTITKCTITKVIISCNGVVFHHYYSFLFLFYLLFLLK